MCSIMVTEPQLAILPVLAEMLIGICSMGWPGRSCGPPPYDPNSDLFLLVVTAFHLAIYCSGKPVVTCHGTAVVTLNWSHSVAGRHC
jgi:hypothetical protein